MQPRSCGAHGTPAEQRQQYLTEKFESGRWRRSYSERDFLGNISEAKLAVQTWRGLSAPTAVEGLLAVPPSLKVATSGASRHRRIEFEALPAHEPIEIMDAVPAELEASDDVPVEPAVDMLALERALDIPDAPFDLPVIEQRYQLLRNML